MNDIAATTSLWGRMRTRFRAWRGRTQQLSRISRGFDLFYLRQLTTMICVAFATLLPFINTIPPWIVPALLAAAGLLQSIYLFHLLAWRFQCSLAEWACLILVMG